MRDTSTITKWLEIAGILSIILSLIFVGVEIQQNTATSEAQALLDLNVAANEIASQTTEVEDFAQIMLKRMEDPSSLSPLERIRFRTWVYNILNVHEAAFIFYQKGVLDDDSYATWTRSTCSLIGEPGVEEIWLESDLVFQPEFDQHIKDSCELAVR
jgi:hypothetical protein